MNPFFVLNTVIPLLDVLKESHVIETEMTDNKRVLSALKFICKISKGDKINCKYRFVQQDSLSTTISRTFIYRDSRANTIKFIQEIIDKSFEIVRNYSHSDKPYEKALMENIIADLVLSKVGISNLKDTYAEDLGFCAIVDTILEDIDARLNETNLGRVKEVKEVKEPPREVPREPRETPKRRDV